MILMVSNITCVDYQLLRKPLKLKWKQTKKQWKIAQEPKLFHSCNLNVLFNI